jgi:hypothetical protein
MKVTIVKKAAKPSRAMCPFIVDYGAPTKS